jgi:hypothetical protein
MVGRKIALIGNDIHEKDELYHELIINKVSNEDSIFPDFLEDTEKIKYLLDFICEQEIKVIIFEPSVDLNFVGAFAEKAWEMQNFSQLRPLVIFYDCHGNSQSLSLSSSLEKDGVTYFHNRRFVISHLAA